MKGQGLPFSTIVLAVIAVLILVLIVFFITGGFSKVFPAIYQQGVSNVQTAKAKCQQYLAEAQLQLSSSMNPNQDFGNTKYCKALFYIPNSQNNNNNNRGIHCWEDPINIKANFVVTTPAGKSYRCYIDQSNGCTCQEITQ